MNSHVSTIIPMTVSVTGPTMKWQQSNFKTVQIQTPQGSAFRCIYQPTPNTLGGLQNDIYLIFFFGLNCN